MLHPLHFFRPWIALKLCVCVVPVALFVVGLAALITHFTRRKPTGP
jgi:hypothetical protein